MLQLLLFIRYMQMLYQKLINYILVDTYRFHYFNLDQLRNWGNMHYKK